MRRFGKILLAPALLAPVLLSLALLGLTSPVQAQEAYKIQPGDTLQLDVLEDGSLSRPLLVLPDGTVSVPSGGTIRAQGLDVATLQSAITTALAPNFAKPPTVYLSVGQISPEAKAEAKAAASGGSGPGTTVYLMGEVKNPGKAQITRGTTLLQFLAEAGGLTPFAATKRIQLRRMDASGQEQVYLFNYAAIQAGAPAQNIQLQKGDVIVVPARRLFE